MEAKKIQRLIKESRNHDGEGLIDPAKLVELSFAVRKLVSDERLSKLQTDRIRIEWKLSHVELALIKDRMKVLTDDEIRDVLLIPDGSAQRKWAINNVEIAQIGAQAQLDKCFEAFEALE